MTKDGALLDLGSSRRQEDKQFIAALNIFALLNRLELDESFGFIIPDGIKIFKLVKVMPHDIKCQNTKVVNDGIQ